MHAVPKMGPPGGPIFRTVFRFIFEVFCIRVVEAQSFGFNDTLWLIATGRATREALLSEAGFEKVFRPRIGSVGASCFVDDFVLGQAGCISVAA